MHRLLARQLRRLKLDADEPPQSMEQWSALLERVSDAYEGADQHRYVAERSMRLSSAEMAQLNQEVRDLSAERISRSEKHYRDLFDQTPIPTWEEDFSALAGWLGQFRDLEDFDLEEYLETHQAQLEEAVSLIEVTNVNPAAIELVRAADKSQLLGAIDPRLVNTESKPSFITQITAIWNREEDVKLQLTGSRLDGGRFHGILQCHVPVIEDEVDYSRVLVTIVDITEQTESERQIRKVMQSKDEFLASISHELRTPLTSVLGFAQILRSSEEAGDIEERDALLGIIADQAADLSDIVEDLLVAARSDLGQLTVVGVPIDVHAQLAQVYESRGNADDSVTLPERPVEKVLAKGDPQRVRQILRNLLTNASRYGGPNVRIGVESGSNYVRISVMDDGKGIKGVAEDRIFDRYSRNGDVEGQPGSVGIGLTISRDLARRMGGDLVYRRIDDWTTFELTLPSINAEPVDEFANQVPRNSSISAARRSA